MTSAASRAHRLRIALLVNLVIVVVQVVVGLGAHSIGLLADAAHNITDVAGLVISFVAVQLSRRPATAHRSYGWHRGPILAAQANAALILAVTVWIVVEGVRRLGSTTEVSGLPVLVVALVAFVANAGAAWAVHEPHPSHPAGDHDDHDDRGDHDDHAPARSHHHRRDLNMHGALLHLVGDAAASLGVAIAGAVILLTDGWYWLDPAVSLLIGLSIGRHAWHLLRSSNAILLEGAPEGLDPEALRADVLAVQGVEAVHDLHVWVIGSELTALSAHLVVPGCPTLVEARAVVDAVRERLRDGHGIAHATLELEPDPCGAHEHLHP